MNAEGRSWAGLWITTLTALVGAVVALWTALLALFLLLMALGGVTEPGGLLACADRACVGGAWLLGLSALASVMVYIVVVMQAAISTTLSLRWAMRLGYYVGVLLAAVVVVAAILFDGSQLVLLPMVPVLGLLGLGSELRLRARGERGLLLAIFDRATG